MGLCRVLWWSLCFCDGGWIKGGIGVFEEKEHDVWNSVRISVYDNCGHDPEYLFEREGDRHK